MPRIPTLIHGLIDYVVGAGLIATPELTHTSSNRSASPFSRAMGVSAIAYALCTDYELGAFKLIPMPAHLHLDKAWAVALALAPWALRFGRRGTRYWLPHALVATMAIVVIGLSEESPSRRENSE